jgi:hypothetical protein
MNSPIRNPDNDTWDVCENYELLIKGTGVLVDQDERRRDMKNDPWAWPSTFKKLPERQTFQ